MTGAIFALYLAALAGMGLIIGSFLNVVAYRVPIKMSVVHPRSACPTCKNPIASYDNIPVISWLLLRGKCRHCKTPIPDRYPLVEAMTGIAWVITGLWAWQPGFLDSTGTAPLINPLLPLVLILVSVGIALWLIDLDHMILPDVLVLPLYPIAVLGLAAAGLATGDWPIARALLSMLVWFAVFAVLYFGSLGRAMGFGDVKLAPVLGLVLGWIGWGPSVIGIFAGFVVGGLYGLTLIARKKAGRRSRVPFGPFLLLGAYVGMLAGDSVWNWYLNMMGM